MKEIMKKGIKLCLVGLILILIGLALRAGVQERNIPSQKQFKFDLNPGDWIIVIRAGYTKKYVRVTPIEFKEFNYKVPDGKKLSGILILK